MSWFSPGDDTFRETSGSFSVSNPVDSRFIRMTNLDGYSLMLGAVEFFGTLAE
jgi:hypothetical protein